MLKDILFALCIMFSSLLIPIPDWSHKAKTINRDYRMHSSSLKMCIQCHASTSDNPLFNKDDIFIYQGTKEVLLEHLKNSIDETMSYNDFTDEDKATVQRVIKELEKK